MGANAEGAGAAIGAATDRINMARGDLAYATGKMDTANIQKWLNGADSLLNTAKTANTNSQYERAAGYARAAADLAMVAETQMAQTLESNCRFKSSRSLKATKFTPGISGANGTRYFGCPVVASEPNVRP